MSKIERKIADYTNNSDLKIQTTQNVIALNKKITTKNHSPKRNYFFKESSAAEASKEAAAAAFYRLLIGDRAPQISLVYNSQNECIGTISKEIEGFTSAASNRKKYRNFEQSSWIKSGLARILVSSMIFAEGDLTESNWGFDKNDNLVRIDFDRSLDIVNHRITARDVLNLLELKDFNTNSWPTISWGNKDSNEYKQFESEKWHYFIKGILLNKDLLLNRVESN
ncbi:MAG: hypothetical protein H0U73_09795 [Tatlockia sp.]|nr:hypothetical protein [Tatlockia sp.]